MNEQERQELQANLAALRSYAAELPAGDPERLEVERTIQDGENVLSYSAPTPEPELDEDTLGGLLNKLDAQQRVYAQDPEPEEDPQEPEEDPEDTDPGADNDPDGLSDKDLEAMISEARSASAAQAQDPDEDPEPDSGKRNYSMEDVMAERAQQQHQDTRLDNLRRYAQESISLRVDGLIEKGVLFPAERADTLALAYSLAGLGGDAKSGVRVYSDDDAGRRGAVDAFIGLLSSREDLSLARNYTAVPDNSVKTPAEPVLPANVTVNADSRDLAQKIRAYAEKHGIKDYGKAMLAFEKENKPALRTYAQSARGQ